MLWAFVAWEQRRARLGQDQLLDTSLLDLSQLRAGLSTLVGQQLVLMGTFFVIPVYLQVVVGLDAFETGKRLLPLSVAMLVFALLGPRIAARRSPRTVAQAGLVAVSVGALVMLGTLEVTLNEPGFKVALGLVGAGAGLLASQLGNVIMSSVAPTQTSEAGGLQGTAQNLGSSLGTAIIGAVLLSALATGFSERITTNPDVPAAARETIVARTQEGIDIVPVAAVEDAAVDGGLTQDQARAVAVRLRRCPARGTSVGSRRRRARGAAVAVGDARTADQIARRERGRLPPSARRAESCPTRRCLPPASSARPPPHPSAARRSCMFVRPAPGVTTDPSKPAPSSRTSKTRPSRSPSAIVTAAPSPACFEAFCTASRQQKYTAFSTSAG